MDKILKEMNEKLAEEQRLLNLSKIKAIPNCIINGTICSSSTIVNYNGYDVEFLIEFDTNKPYYGIYYGARLCLQKDSLVELSNLEKDFKPIRKRITDVLELPLRTSDIVGKENGKIVFWPFSVTLGEEQDISVAENNLKKMKDVFEDIIAQKYAFSFKVVQ